MERYYDVVNVVEKLIGPIEPVGCSNENARRLKNLGELASATRLLVGRIADVTRWKNSHEASVRKAGETAGKCLQEIRDMLIED